MLKTINLHFEKFLYWTTALATSIFFVMVCMNVFARYILNAPILGSVEISRLAFVWASFLAAALCYRQQSHIAITFVVDKLPARIVKWVLLVIYTLTFVFFVIIFYFALQVTFDLRGTSFPVMQITQSWLYLPVAVISFFIAFFSVEEIMNTIKTNQSK